MIPRKAGFVIACIGFIAFCGLSIAKEVSRPIISIAALQSAADGRYTVIATVSGGNGAEDMSDTVLSDGTGSVVAMGSPDIEANYTPEEDYQKPVRSAQEIRDESKKWRDTIGDRFVAYVEVIKENQFYRTVKITPKQIRGSWGQRTIQTADGFRSLSREEIKQRRQDDLMDDMFTREK
jgi:hypothetical protein